MGTVLLELISLLSSKGILTDEETLSLFAAIRTEAERQQSILNRGSSNA